MLAASHSPSRKKRKSPSLHNWTSCISFLIVAKQTISELISLKHQHIMILSVRWAEVGISSSVCSSLVLLTWLPSVESWAGAGTLRSPCSHVWQLVLAVYRGHLSSSHTASHPLGHTVSPAAKPRLPYAKTGFQEAENRRCSSS